MNIENEISLADKKVSKKLNVLFIGPYRQPDGWGSFSRSIISSLLSIEEVDLTTRPIFLSSSPEVVTWHPHRVSAEANIFKCESNKKENYDVLIQHALPIFMVGSDNFGLNIGITSFETKGNVQWDNHLRLLDKILVPTEAEKQCASQELQDRIHTIGGVVANFDIPPNVPLNRFSFYVFGGHMESKSGILTLLQSYLSEFHINENVSLIIHTTNNSMAQEIIGATAKSLGIYNKAYYPHIHVVEENPDDSLHKQCQCLVDMGISRGFREEVAKGLLYGKTPIILKNSGMDEYIDDSNGFIVDSHESIIICPDRPIHNAFTGREFCLTPNGSSLRKCLRSAVEDRSLYREKSTNGTTSYPLFSTEKQSRAIKEILCLQ